MPRAEETGVCDDRLGDHLGDRSTLVVSNGSGSAIRALSDLGYPVPRDLARPVASIVAVNDDSGPALTVMGGVGFGTADVLTIPAGSRCSESVSPGAIPSARTQVLATLQGPGGSLQFANLQRICLEAPASRNVWVAYFVMQ